MSTRVVSLVAHSSNFRRVGDGEDGGGNIFIFLYSRQDNPRKYCETGRKSCEQLLFQQRGFGLGNADVDIRSGLVMEVVVTLVGEMGRCHVQELQQATRDDAVKP